MTDREWCKALADALSRASGCPSVACVNDVRALLQQQAVMGALLTGDWLQLVHDARRWLLAVDGGVPRFHAPRQIDAALRAMPAALPAWAEQEENRLAAREAQLAGGDE
jgi:hypothetical protein